MTVNMAAVVMRVSESGCSIVMVVALVVALVVIVVMAVVWLWLWCGCYECESSIVKCVVMGGYNGV